MEQVLNWTTTKFGLIEWVKMFFYTVFIHNIGSVPDITCQTRQKYFSNIDNDTLVEFFEILLKYQHTYH